MSQTIAIIMTEVFLRRLTPGLIPFVRQKQDFKVISIHRPLKELIAVLSELQPKGLITEWIPHTTDGLLELKIPTVIAATDLSFPGMVSIDVDDRAVGASAANAFQQAGFRSFACLSNGTPYSEQRIAGFCQTVGKAVPVHQELTFDDTRYSENFVTPSAKLTAWLKALPKPVGIFAVHDPLGRFLCSSCQQLGIKVPDQVAIIGANNDELVCSLSYPMLSSVSIPWDTIGALVGDSMQQMLQANTAPPEPILVPPGGVVLRHSANHLAIEDPLLRRAMSYLTERLEAPISIGQMCDELRVARRTSQLREKV